MSGKPRKDKKYNPNKIKKPTEEYDLTQGEFMTLGMLQKTIEAAQQAISVYLSNLALTKWKYGKDVELGFAINWDDGKVRVDIQRDENENVQPANGNDTIKKSTK